MLKSEIYEKREYFKKKSLSWNIKKGQKIYQLHLVIKSM